MHYSKTILKKLTTLLQSAKKKGNYLETEKELIMEVLSQVTDAALL